jgi:hypothetical protein
MNAEKEITLHIKEGEPVQVNIDQIKKIVELKGYGSRLYLLPDTNQTQTQLDVIETYDKVKSLLISIK